MNQLTKYFQIFLLVFSVIVVGFVIYDIATLKPAVPEFYPIGASADDIIPVYEELGFSFTDSERIYDQPQTVGISKDGLSVIQLIGPKDNLVNVRVVIRLSKGMKKSELNQKRSYLDTMIDLVLPDWGDGHDWFKEKALDLGDGGSRNIIVGDVKVTVAASSKNMTLGLTFGDWSTIPVYDTNSKKWETG